MKVKLCVDGVEIPMNRFVRSVLGDVIVAIVSNLKGVERWRRIEVSVEL